MRKPELSPDFTMEDIRKLRDYNSARHLTMADEEVRAEGKKAMETFLISIGRTDKLKMLRKMSF